jgi:dUTP pyrophosphatase
MIMQYVDLKVKTEDDTVQLPVYSTDGAACFDIFAWKFKDRESWIEHASLSEGNRTVTIRTGLYFEIPKGYKLNVYSRSGQGFKYDVRLANCVGIIDFDYRGELMVKLTFDSVGTVLVSLGDRIAQAEIVPIVRANLLVVDSLEETTRGTNGFGSTGK